MVGNKPAAKVQFNVYLPAELVRELKHRAIDEGVSLSALVEHIATGYLASQASQAGPAGQASPAGQAGPAAQPEEDDQ